LICLQEKAKVKVNPVSRCRASSFLLLAQKKRTKEKGLPRRNSRGASGGAGIFGLAIPWLDPKTAAIHGGRPPGSRPWLPRDVDQERQDQEQRDQ
jgi:hypothetical protein